jgi:hypothetical protein
MSLDNPIFLTILLAFFIVILVACLVALKTIRDQAAQKLEQIRADVKKAAQVVLETRTETLRYEKLKLYEEKLLALRQVVENLNTVLHQTDRASQGLAQQTLNSSLLPQIWSRLPIWQWQRLQRIEKLAGEAAQFQTRIAEINRYLDELRAIPKRVAENIIRLEGRVSGMADRLQDAELIGAEVDEKNSQLEKLEGEVRKFSAWAWQTRQVDPLMLSRDNIEQAPASERAAQEIDSQLGFLETIINRWLADWNKITVLQKEALQNWDAALAMLNSLPPSLVIDDLLVEFKTCEEHLQDCPRNPLPLHVGALSELVTGLPVVVREVKGLLKKVRDLQWSYDTFSSLTRDNVELLTRIHEKIEQGTRANAYSIVWDPTLTTEMDELADQHAAIQDLAARRAPEELKEDIQTAQATRLRAEKLEKAVNETAQGRETHLQVLTVQMQNNAKLWETIRAEIEQGAEQVAYPIAWAPATLDGLEVLRNEQVRLENIQAEHNHQDLRDDIEAAKALYVRLQQFSASLQEAIENSQKLLKRYQKLDSQIWENWVSIVNLYSEVKRYDLANWPAKDQVNTLLFDAQKLNNQIQVFTGKHSPKDQPLLETQVNDTLAEIGAMAEAWQAVLERRDDVQKVLEELQSQEKAILETINRVLDILVELDNKPVLDPLEIQGDALLTDLENRQKGLLKDKVAGANTWLESCEAKLKEMQSGLRPQTQRAYDQLDDRVSKIQKLAVLSDEAVLKNAISLHSRIGKLLQSIHPANTQLAPVERIEKIAGVVREAQQVQEQTAQAMRRLDGEIDLPLQSAPGSILELKDLETQVKERTNALRAKAEKNQNIWPQFACDFEKIERETRQVGVFRMRLHDIKTVVEAKKLIGELNTLYANIVAEIAVQEKSIETQQAGLGQEMAQVKALETRLRVKRSDAMDDKSRQEIEKCLKEIETGTQRVQQSTGMVYADAKHRLDGLLSAARGLLGGEK